MMMSLVSMPRSLYSFRSQVAAPRVARLAHVRVACRRGITSTRDHDYTSMYLMSPFVCISFSMIITAAFNVPFDIHSTKQQVILYQNIMHVRVWS